MDSPESSKLKTTNPAETAPVQESPVFSYISNLSPIQTAKASSVTQGFPGLNSPPLVFTSPRLNTRSQSTFLKREVFPRISSAKLNEKFESVKNSVTTIKGHGELDIQSSSTSVASCEKATDSSNSVDELILSPSGSHEQFLEDIVNVDSLDPKFSFDSAINKSEYNDQPTDTPTCSKEILISIEDKLNTGTNEEIAVAPPVTSRQTEEVKNEITLISVCATENFIKQGDEVSVDHCPKIEHELPAVDSLVNQDEDKFMNENAEAGETATLDQSSYLLTESKAFQNRGARRRCLQFGDAQHNAISNRPVQDPSDGEADKSPSLETPSTPIDWKLYPTNTMDSSIKIPTPSGIGLHLNRIVNTAQSGSATKVHVKAAQLETTDGNKHGSHHACESDDSASALSTHIAEPANDSVILNSKADQSTIGNKRKIMEKSSGLEKINKLSPKKKRIKPTESGDGCQRCNCKRSKCLKLYCDCFAAGIYCAEPCACQECFNRPEYEDIVIETRQKIETRDPFAFAPRVVQHIVDQPTISCGEDGSNFTPASARHKKGCKCKKSMCLKKYCECYQANVGCSDGCRCEGCKNVFGQKGEYGTTKVVLTREDAKETTDASYIQDCEITAASRSHTYHAEFVNPHHLTPPTPAFEFSNHGKEASKARFPSGKFSMTPESGFTYVAPYVMPLCSPITSDNNVTIPESAKDLLDMDYFDQESHHCNAETVDEFSAAYPQSGKMHLSDIPNLQKWADNSKGQSRRNYLSGSSLGWRGSPITPMPQFSGIKTPHEVGFDVELSNTVQDDSPEILRDTSTPLNIVKASSPNKKRVSPPHGQFITSSSAGIQTGRKFILRAIPSFPPLTPCVDSKAPVMQRDNIPENHRDNE